MTTIPGGALLITAHAPPTPLPGHDLLPPDEWLGSGDMVWLTHEGTLLGLLWTDGCEVSAHAAQVVTLLLTAARQDMSFRDSSLLVTQIPTPVAWLDGELRFRQVSRHFLTLHQLTETQVLGQTVNDVFVGRHQLLSYLQQALDGHAVRLPTEFLGTVPSAPAGRPDQGEGLWVRGEARPYFGGDQAGVLWTTQDASAERGLALQLDSLLDDVNSMLALLDRQGRVLNASSSMLNLMPASPSVLLGAPLWSWPCWAQVPEPEIQRLVELAGRGGAAETTVPTAGGRSLQLRLRGDHSGGRLLIAECTDLSQARAKEQEAALQSTLLSEILTRSGEATLLINHLGKVTLANEDAAQMLGIGASQLLGASLLDALLSHGVQMLSPTTQEPLDYSRWERETMPAEQEIVLISGGGQRRTVRLGAALLPTLGTRRAGVMLTLRDMTALRRAEARLRHDSHHDSLTGLYNRPGLRAALSTLGDQPLTLLTLDIDGFAAINSGLGRVASDALLIQLAARLTRWPHGTYAGRLSNDTFAVAIPSGQQAVPTGEQHAAETEQALRVLLSEPMRTGRRDVPLTYTFGLSSGPASQAERLLDEAETALNYAKREGRALSAHYQDRMRASVAESFRLEGEIRSGLEGGQFALTYQPIVDLVSGGLLRAEALMRWHHPELGVLTPKAFLPLASHSSLMSSVGDWVVRSAMKGRAQWAAARPGVPVSVNLSLEELLRQGSLEELFPLMEADGAPDFEMHASSLTAYSDQTLSLLERLRGLGARLYVDDFGDGASSLTALERFPLTGVKLHPSFVARLHEPRALTLLEGTTHLASRLGLSVTAVGVETAEQARLLRQAGVHAAQGYLYSAPVSAEELAAYRGQAPQE